MSETNLNPDHFEPELTPAQLAEQNLEPFTVRGITFYREALPICPACEDGDHEHSWICEADYKCACACHQNGRQNTGDRSAARKPAVIDYERLGYELAIAPSKEAA